MEHRTSAEFKGYAAVIRPQELSKKELLERWSLSLEKRKGFRLCTLRETEHKSLKEQVSLRKDNSPLTLPSRIRCCDRQVWRAINLARSHDFLGYHLGSFTTWCVTAILGKPWPPRWWRHACDACQDALVASRHLPVPMQLPLRFWPQLF